MRSKLRFGIFFVLGLKNRFHFFELGARRDRRSEEDQKKFKIRRTKVVIPMI
jgi:hypothetical protein